MFCQKCGSKLPDDALFCQNCGTRVLREDTIQQSAVEMSMEESRSEKSETIEAVLQTAAESSPVSASKGDSFVVQKHFEAFVDNHIRKTTQFQTTEELLNSQVPLPFVKKILKTSAVLGIMLGILLCICGYALGNTNLTDATNLVVILGILLFALLIGYAVAYFKSLIVGGQYASKYDGKFEGNIDIEDLIQFLNEYLGYISPYFHQWGYMTRSAFGVRGIALNMLENSMQRAMKEIRICTEFGKKKMQLSVIVLRPDPINTELGNMEYFTSAENRFEGPIASLIATFHHDYGFEKYKCLVRTAPILQAAMEYYLKVYKKDGGKETAVYGGNDVEQIKGVSQKESTVVQQFKTDVAAGTINQQIQEDTSKKKKSKKLPIILGVAVLVIILVIIIAVNWEGEPDYVASVKAHTPFAVSQELPYTYEEVLNKYFDSLKWEVRKDGDIHYVDISGTVKEVGGDFDLTIKVSQNPDVSNGAFIEPQSITLDDRQSTTESETSIVLYNLFCMYDEGYEITEISEGEDTTFQEEPSSMETDNDVNALTVDVRFNDIPITELLNSSAVELVQKFGGNYYANGDGGISYDEIEFYMLDDETVGYIWSFYPEYFSINGNILTANSEGVIYSDEIIELLGTDYEDESLSSGYYMTYYYPTYTLSFGINKFSEVSDIRIYNLAGGSSEASDYASANNSSGYYEPIDNYRKLDGFYIGNVEQSTLSLSIYTSQEEGEIEIGGADIYVNNGLHYYGSVIPIEEKVYKVEVETGEEVLLKEVSSDNDVVVQLYVNGQYLEEYQMIEHYEH